MMKIEDFAISKRSVTAIKKAGFNELADFEGKTKQEIKKIKGLGETGYAELLDYLKTRGIKLVFAPKEKKVSSIHPMAKKLVEGLFRGQKAVNWGIEIKIASNLINKWGFDSLSRAIEDLSPPDLYSLKYFNLPWFDLAVQKYIPKETVIIKPQEKVEEAPLEDVELPEYKAFEGGPKSLKDFLKLRK